MSIRGTYTKEQIAQLLWEDAVFQGAILETETIEVIDIKTIINDDGEEVLQIDFTPIQRTIN